MVLKSFFLHKQMTEKIASEMTKNIKHIFVHFLITSKIFRQNPKPFLDRFFHHTFILETISHGQIIEKFAFEVRL